MVSGHSYAAWTPPRHTQTHTHSHTHTQTHTVTCTHTATHTHTRTYNCMQSAPTASRAIGRWLRTDLPYKREGAGGWGSGNELSSIYICHILGHRFSWQALSDFGARVVAYKSLLICRHKLLHNCDCICKQFAHNGESMRKLIELQPQRRIQGTTTLCACVCVCSEHFSWVYEKYFMANINVLHALGGTITFPSCR